VFLEKFIIAKQIKKCHTFVEANGSLPCPQKYYIEHCPESIESLPPLDA